MDGAALDDGERTRQAGQLLALAQTDFHEQRYLGCLEPARR